MIPGMVEIEYHIVIHLPYPIVHTQQAQNNKTNAFTNSMTVDKSLIFFFAFLFSLEYLP